MSRLIDADVLIKELVSNEIQPTKDIENYIEGWCEGYNTVVDIINEQPTAYNVDKVVEELENTSNLIQSEEGCGWLNFTEEAIDIVRKGGV